MNLYDATVPIFQKTLSNLDRWIEKAIAHAGEKKFDPEILANARLAPDQYPLVGQVQSACDAAKFTVAKMTGKEAPSHPDTEKTVAELRARIRTVLNYLETYKREDFVDCEDRPVTHTWMEGKLLRAGDYLDHFALPNYYFHVMHAYAILRHNGVPLGKMDVIAPLPFKS